MPKKEKAFERHTVKELLTKAERDSDPVSIFSTGPRHAHIVEYADRAVVVIRGRDVLRCFREWAERNRLLTPRKPVEGHVEVTE